MSDTDKDLNKKIEAMNKIANGNLGKKIKTNSERLLKGAVAGGIIGLVGAIALRTKPIYGIVLGSIVGRQVYKKIKKND